MKDFYRAVRKHNKFRMGWLLLWCLGICMYMISGTEEKKLLSLNAVMAAVLFFSGASDFVSKHLSINKGEHKGSMFGGNDMRLQYGRMEDIMRFHSFDTSEYFGLIAKNFLPVQAVTEAIVIAYGILAEKKVVSTVFFGALVLVLPPVVNFCRKKYMERRLTSELGGAEKTLVILVKAICMILKLVSFIAAGLVIILGLSIISDQFWMRGIDNDEAVLFSATHGNIFLIICIIAAVLILLTMVDSNIISDMRVSVKKALTVLMAVVMLASGALYVYLGTKENVIFRADSITVNEKGESVSYTYDRVTDYRVYSRDNSLGMTLVMDDERKIEVFEDITSVTDGWDKEYRNDYYYAAALVEIFKANGAKGSFEGESQLRKATDGMDGDIKSGFEKLTDVLGAR